MESRKIAPINLVSGQEYGRVDTGGEREDGMNWEVKTDIYILPYIVLCDDLGGLDGEGWEGGSK